MSRPDPQFFRFGPAEGLGPRIYIQNACTTEHPSPNDRSEFERLAQRAADYGTERPFWPLRCPYIAFGGFGPTWPAFFNIHCSDHRLLVRDDVARLMCDAGFTGFDFDTAVIGKISSRKLAAMPPPAYHALVPIGWMSVTIRVYRHDRKSDRSFFEFDSPDRTNPRIQEFLQQHGKYEYRTVPLVETWDGSDIFRTRDHPGLALCCTRRFFDFIRQHEIPGLFFHPLDALGQRGDNDDYRTRPWPPSLWYPRRQPLDHESSSDLPPPPPEPVVESPKSPKPPAPPPGPELDYETRLHNPQFDLIEQHFGHPVPAALRQMYADPAILSREPFSVSIPSVDKPKHWFVESFTPIDPNTLEFFEGFEQYIGFASDGSEGIYVIDPTQPDPEVYYFDMEGYTLDPCDSTLSQFLTFPTTSGYVEEEEDEGPKRMSITELLAALGVKKK